LIDCQITNIWLWPPADYEPYCGCACIYKVRWLLHEHEDDSVKLLESIATTAFAKWKYFGI